MGSTWPFLLMYGSHGMRHTGFPQVDGGQRDPRDRGVTFLSFSPYLRNFRKSINLIIYKLYEIIWIFMVINLFYIIFIKNNMKLYEFTIINIFIFIFMK